MTETLKPGAAYRIEHGPYVYTGNYRNSAASLGNPDAPKTLNFTIQSAPGFMRDVEGYEMGFEEDEVTVTELQPEAPALRMPLDADAKPLTPGTTYKVRIRTSDEHPSVTRLLVFRYVHVEDDGSRTFVWLDVEGPVGYSEEHHVSVEPLRLDGWTQGELQEAYGR